MHNVRASEKETPVQRWLKTLKVGESLSLKDGQKGRFSALTLVDGRQRIEVQLGKGTKASSMIIDPDHILVPAYLRRASH